jgi:hypothetical protein
VRFLFFALAVAFVVAGVFHAVEAIAGHGVIARHWAFVGIDAVAAVLLIRRPPGTAIVFAILCGQQIVSHGGDLLRLWASEHRIDVSDVAVLFVMPLTLGALVVDARRARLRARARPPL